jgi:hypothetical protein
MIEAWLDSRKGETKQAGEKLASAIKPRKGESTPQSARSCLLKPAASGSPERVLEDFLELFSAIAMTHQPTPPGAERNPNYDEKKFEKFARLAVEIATALASYRTPKLKAVLVGPELRQSNAPERLSHEELIKRLEERGLPTSIFGIAKPGPLSIEQ